MEIKIPDGKYILAVSGGVDSMALLDLLSNLSGVELIVTHFNHGIRADSDRDEALVRSIAVKYGLQFETASGNLGKTASEAVARDARYQFLESIRRKHKALAIITAHHQDDLIETAILNLLRGTGRRGLVALAANPTVVRPLLGHSKLDILRYAGKRQLTWREDSSNLDDSYLRNYIRHHVTPKLSVQQRQNLISNIDKVAKIEDAINPQIAKLSQKTITNQLIDRRTFISLPTDLGNELVLFWLRQRQVRQPDIKMVKRLNTALRASKEGTVQSVGSGWSLLIGRESARFCHTL